MPAHTTRPNLLFHEVSLFLNLQPKGRKTRDEVDEPMVDGVGEWRRLDTNLVVSERKRVDEGVIHDQAVVIVGAVVASTKEGTKE